MDASGTLALPPLAWLGDVSALVAGLIGGKTMADEDMKAELERFRRENAALKKEGSTNIRIEVSVPLHHAP
jgi:hypothetical protein